MVYEHLETNVIIDTNMSSSQPIPDYFLFAKYLYKQVDLGNCRHCMFSINIHQLKTARNTPVVKQIGFNAHCSDGTHGVS